MIDHLSEKIPENFAPRFKSLFRTIEGPLNPIFFREQLLNGLEEDRGLRQRVERGASLVISTDEIDHILYSLLPLFPVYELRERIEKIISFLPMFSVEKREEIMKLFDQIPLSRREYPIIGATQLQEICKALICLSEGKATTSDDFHFLISHAAQALGFAMPTPLIFADSNWVKEMFGFTVNPGSGRLELWRFDYTGSVGYPMSGWKSWVNGSRPDLRWGVYVKPYQYGQV